MGTEVGKYVVKGMTCGGCTASVQRAIEGAVPNTKVAVTLEGGRIEVVGVHDVKQVEQAIEDAGFEFVGVHA